MQSLLLALAVVTTALPAVAQDILPPVTSGGGRTLSMGQPSQDYAVLHVNSATGNDQLGVGSAEQPYKTITQALKMAPTTSTVLLLAPGHYNQESGESFPLRLRPGITIQGNPGETRNTIIVGGGEFRGDDMGQTVTHNVTIVTSDRSGLANIAVSNPNGSGVWITGGTPILRRIALVSNTIAGVQVANGAPVIENSYFNLNQQGVSIRGTGQAIVRGNYFEATGRAITVASPATPAINNNRLARNEVGIALKNNARPVLEANVLDGNGRNGVVEVDVVEADVAETVAETPVPLASAIVAPSASAPVVAPTTVAPAPVAAAPAAPSPRSDLPGERNAVLLRPEPPANAPGSSSLAAVERRTALRAAPVPAVSEVETEPEAEPAGEIVSEVEVPRGAIASFGQHLAASSAPDTMAADEGPAILQQRQSSPELAAGPLAPADLAPVDLASDDAIEADLAPADLTSDDAIEIAVIPLSGPDVGPEDMGSHDESSEARQRNVSKLLARLQQRPAAAAPIASPETIDPETIDQETDHAPVASGQRLPVPSAAIPSSGGTANLPPPGAVSLARSFRYRVLVDMADADELQRLVPDAFRTQVGRDVFMQAGAYVDEVEAQERLAWLRENGIEGSVNLRE
ncbi:DUF1565 domain-containing protein [Leptothoe sp. PORK10 BA2]|uniref:DUF1565 domain-containing protein n=1 Tax=Leptothoe sp. PORK10 BA2 TaxID=3110254 RepID=UPI002B203EB2|nr:DUF1565 domain-containing protein [Leptothoe sp. PORK10 BA2]MEA5463116.1 DUF1565 domain-containing protein [Leptothoe sp. PORK10 BA2]